MAWRNDADTETKHRIHAIARHNVPPPHQCFGVLRILLRMHHQNITRIAMGPSASTSTRLECGDSKNCRQPASPGNVSAGLAKAWELEQRLQQTRNYIALHLILSCLPRGCDFAIPRITCGALSSGCSCVQRSKFVMYRCWQECQTYGVFRMRYRRRGQLGSAVRPRSRYRLTPKTIGF